MGGAKKKGRIRPIKKQKLDEVRSEINVTPLVDVCLVLLIIFMVVTPMLARGKEVPLPKTDNHQEEKDNNQPIVAVTRDGKLFFDKDQVPNIDEMVRLVGEAWRSDETGMAQGKVYVKADAQVEYGKVYPIIIALHELGIPTIDLGTNEKREDK